MRHDFLPSSLDQQTTAAVGVGGTTEVSIALQAINILSGGQGDGVCSSFLAVLFADISNGHHPIIPIAALGLLCLLLKLDRASGLILETVIRDGCLQVCLPFPLNLWMSMQFILVYCVVLWPSVLCR